MTTHKESQEISKRCFDDFYRHSEGLHAKWSVSVLSLYIQTDTICQTYGPLVPMVQLVPIENDVIPMVLLVNMHLIKRT